MGPADDLNSKLKGVDDGVDDGIADGSGVGDKDGSEVIALVGIADGSGVGDDEGFTLLGATLGTGDGIALGAVVAHKNTLPSDEQTPLVQSDGTRHACP